MGNKDAAADNALPQVAAAPSEPVVVTTDRMKVTFDLNGARVVGSEMLLFPQQASWTEVGLAGKVLGKTPAPDLATCICLNSAKAVPTWRKVVL